MISAYRKKFILCGWEMLKCISMIETNSIEKETLFIEHDIGDSVWHMYHVTRISLHRQIHV